jgi:3-hydroxyisobutyrate dehydrogenase-like beta-hydroxyacid dehydrogenase
MTAATVLGLGEMGAALARSLLAGGVDVTVWNRSPERADPLVAAGAARATGPGDAASSSDLVVVCVVDDQASRAVLSAMDGALRGRVVADLTTRTPEAAEDAARWVAGQEATLLDGVVQAAVPQVGTPDATLLYSGPRRAFTAHEPTLRLLGSAHLVGERAGQASLFDLALMGLWYEAEMAYLQALALVGSAGDVALDVFVPFAARQMGFVVDAAGDVAREVGDRRYPRGPATLVEHLRVLDDLVTTREEAGMRADLLDHAREVARRRIADGHGDQGFTGVIEHLVRERAEGRNG